MTAQAPSVTAVAPTLSELAGCRAVVVASTGGHLEQATRWLDRLALSQESTVVTFDNAQSRSMLAGRRHKFVPYVAPRAGKAIARVARDLLRDRDVMRSDAIVSTGAGVALACLAPALLRRKRLYYIESVSRFEGPSLTGRFLAKLPAIRCYTQHETWASRRWKYAGSLLDEYCVQQPTSGLLTDQPRRIFVTLGTIRPYRFDALVDRVRSLLRPDDEVVWQVGCTDRNDLPGTASAQVPPEEFDRLVREADVVLTHAGVGSIMRALDLGVRPIVIPREKARDEHVDDHQFQVATALADRDLVVLRRALDLTRADLLAPRARVVRGTTQTPMTAPEALDPYPSERTYLGRTVSS